MKHRFPFKCWLTGLTVWVTLGLSALMVLMVNYLASHHPLRFDVSRVRHYALTAETRSLLDHLPTDIRIEFIGQVGELGFCVGIRSEDKGRPDVLDRPRPGNFKSLQTVEAFLPGALKFIHILPGLVRRQLVFRSGKDLGSKQHGPILGAVDPCLKGFFQVFPADPGEMLPLILATRTAFELIGTFQKISSRLCWSRIDLLWRIRMCRQVEKDVARDHLVLPAPRLRAARGQVLSNSHEFAIERYVVSLRIFAADRYLEKMNTVKFSA